MRTTVTVLQARVGGYVGHGHVHPAMVDALREEAASAKASGLVTDAYVARCGERLALVLAHGADDVRSLGRDAFGRAAIVAVKLGLHDAHGPGDNGGIAVGELSIALDGRASEPLVVLLATGETSWDQLLYRVFADPIATPALAGALATGFRFRTDDGAVYDLPEDLYRLAAADGRVSAVTSRLDATPAAVASDAAAIVRCEGVYPGVPDVLSPLAHGTAGRMAPVANNDDAAPFPDPVRVIGLGFQLANGRLVGPRDLFADRAFDAARELVRPAQRQVAAGVRESAYR